MRHYFIGFTNNKSRQKLPDKAKNKKITEVVTPQLC